MTQRWLALVLSLLLPGSASAERVTDKEQTFEITWPETWDPASPLQGMVQAWASTDGSGGGDCLAYRRTSSGLATATQEQLNEKLRTPLSEAEWSNIIGGGKLQGFTSIRVVESAFVSQRATATVPIPIAGAEPGVVRVALFLRPGEVFLAACSEDQSAFQGKAPIFETILDSFHPL